MAVKATAAQAAEAWQNGFSGAATKFTAGVNAVTTAPGQLAAAQKNLYVQNVTAAANTWASKVAAVDLQTWKTATINTGVARLGSGATKGAPKMQSFMTAFLPALTNIVNGLGPRGSFEQNLARFQAYATALHNAKGTF